MQNFLNIDLGGNTRAVLRTEKSFIPLQSRIFVDNTWHDYDFKTAKVSDNLPLKIEWTEENVSDSWLSVKATLTNIGQTPLNLGSFHVIEADTLGTDSDNSTVFVDTGGGWFAGVVKAASRCPDFKEQDKFISNEDKKWIHDIAGNKTKDGIHYSISSLLVYHRGKTLPNWILSFIVPPQRCIAAPLLIVNPQNSKVLRWAMIQQFADYQLQPDESISTETMLLGLAENPHEGLEQWADYCKDVNRIEIKSFPPVGWLSWYGYRLQQSEQETLRVADIINEEFAGLGFEYIQLDLGYNKNNLPGEWFETNERFPNGLAWLVNELEKKGFKAGIWCSPFYVAEDSEFARKHPEALVRDRFGKPIDNGRWSWEPKCKIYVVDSTHPLGEQFIRKAVRHLKSQGFSYFKFDFLAAISLIDEDFVVYDKHKIKGAEIYRHGLKIIRDELDSTDYIYWCSNMVYLGLGLSDTTMIACDIGNTGFSLPCKAEGCADILDFFRRQASTTISRYFLHQRLVLVNADGINIAPPADIEERRLRATLVAMSGSQVFLGDRFDLCDSELLDIVRIITPPYGQAAKPVDLFENVYPNGYPGIWHLKIETGWDTRDAIALLNMTHNEKEFELRPEMFDMDTFDSYYCWEFWTRKRIDIPNDTFKLTISPASTRLLTFVKKRKHPWVISTTFHISQGAVELKNVQWDENSSTLSGILLRPANYSGSIFISVPAEYSHNLPLVFPNIARYEIVARNSKSRWAVRF